MGLEIERKFLLRAEAWEARRRELETKGTASEAGVRYVQGYLSTDKKRTVRVRTMGERAFLTIKGATDGLARREYEYEIPIAEARELLTELCHHPLIEKTRYRIDYEGYTWDVDEFYGENKGLQIAEIELPFVDATFERPPWVGEEVSDDPRYFNANLGAHPFTRW